MSANTQPELKASFDMKDGQAKGVSSISIAVGAESADVRTVVGQLLDANGGPVRIKKIVRVVVWTTAGQTVLATTGGSTGLAVASGTVLVLAATAKKVFDFLSSAEGVVNLTWTDNVTESVAVSMHVDGVSAITAAFANA